MGRPIDGQPHPRNKDARLLDRFDREQRSRAVVRRLSTVAGTGAGQAHARPRSHRLATSHIWKPLRPLLRPLRPRSPHIAHERQQICDLRHSAQAATPRPRSAIRGPIGSFEIYDLVWLPGPDSNQRPTARRQGHL